MRIDDLNPAQREAATTLQGPVLVQAGAGSGKTRMLVARIAYALRSGATELDRIMAITFTDKAAGELSERVRADLREDGRVQDARAVDGAWISTIHGACSRILRENALEIGLDPAFSVLSSVDAYALVEEAFETAAQEALSSSAAANQAFGLFGYGGVRAFTLRLGAACRLKGVDPMALQTAPAASTERIIERLQADIREAIESLESTGLDDDYVAPHIAAVLAYQARIGDLGPTSVAPEAVASEILPLLPAKFSATAKAPVKQANVQLREAIKAAASDLVAVWARPMAEMLGTLATRTVQLLDEAKRSRAALDFDDLQLMTARLLATRPDLAQRYRNQFDLVMVDEFQDTDSLQLQIVEAIAGRNLCTVGDARQSIYRFRGAELDVYRQHVQDMCDTGCAPIELVDNYRSAADVLTFVNTMFGAEGMFGDDLLALQPKRSEDDPWLSRIDLPEDTPRIQAIFVPDAGDASRAAAAAETARRLRELVDAGVPENDIVILMRAYSHADVYAGALRAVGLRPIVLGGSRFLSMPEVVTVEQLARAIANPEDEQALGVVLASDMARLSDDALAALRAEKGRSLWSALVSAAETLDERDARRAAAVAGAIETARTRLGVLSVSETIMEAIERLDYDLVLLAKGDAGREGLANVLKLLRVADEAEASGNYGPAAFAAYVALKREYRDTDAPASIADADTSAIRIMSIHASKGLEFPVVVVPDLGNVGGGGGADDSTHALRYEFVDGEARIGFAVSKSAWGGAEAAEDAMFSRIKEQQREGDVDEHKRLLYVAFTRAREMLLVTALGPAKLSDTPGGFRWMRELLGLTAPLEPMDEIVQIGEVTPVGVGVTVLDREQVEILEDLDVVLGEPMAASEECRAERRRADHRYAPPTQLAYSNLALYERCPQRFFTERVAGVRTPRVPGAASATDFGQTLHSAMEVVALAGGVDDARLLALLAANGLDSNELGRLRDAVARLKGVPDVAKALDSGGRAEMPFAIAVGSRDDGFILQGSLDLYARLDDVALIVDYKTGTSGTAEELADRYRLQAQCYALPAFADGAERARVLFVRPEVLVDDRPQTVVFDFAAADRSDIEARLVDEHRKMRNEMYNRRSEWDEDACGTCILLDTLCDVPRARSAGSS